MDSVLLVEDDPLLVEGEKAIFSTTASADGTHQIVTQPYGHVTVDNSEDEAVKVNRFEDAEANQVPFTTLEDQGPPNNDPEDP